MIQIRHVTYARRHVHAHFNFIILGNSLGFYIIFSYVGINTYIKVLFTLGIGVKHRKTSPPIPTTTMIKSTDIISSTPNLISRSQFMSNLDGVHTKIHVQIVINAVFNCNLPSFYKHLLKIGHLPNCTLNKKIRLPWTVSTPTKSILVGF